jgi:outer membrane immunogenic protein
MMIPSELYHYITVARTYTKAPAMVVDPAYNWSGFYVGLNAGYSQETANFNVTPLPQPAAGTPPFVNNLSPKGFLGGAQAGYNWQSGSFVFGIEADIAGGNVKGSGATVALPGPFFSNVSSALDVLSTVRGRVGVAFDRVLFYGTGGLAVGSVRDYANNNGGGNNPYIGSNNSVRVGYAAGGGIEYGVTQNWSAKVEALYYNLGSTSFIGNLSPPDPTFSIANRVSPHDGYVARLGVNYRFGGPVVAKY